METISNQSNQSSYPIGTHTKTYIEANVIGMHVMFQFPPHISLLRRLCIFFESLLIMSPWKPAIKLKKYAAKDEEFYEQAEEFL